ncbi:hypothetical protein AVEN_175391-1 [Araneus ventricosus]|uniref:DUF4817 domain-containing protein n=1 Tax=Araneus ventricosus TaxID=182803 RepID=A0A4Y2HW58_ARAVE|nr:hypothetical protein AVEN_175391-1 [Araneus ventricosus]
MFFEHAQSYSCWCSFFVENVEIQRISIVKAYYSSNNSPIAAQKTFATEYQLKTTGPSVITIKNMIEKFERAGSVDVSTLQRVLQNFALHLRHVIAIGGKHIEHVIN